MAEAEAVTSRIQRMNTYEDKVCIEINCGKNFRRFDIDASILRPRSRYFEETLSKDQVALWSRPGGSLKFPDVGSKTFKSYLLHISCWSYLEEHPYRIRSKNPIRLFRMSHLRKVPDVVSAPFDELSEEGIVDVSDGPDNPRDLGEPLELAKIYVFAEKVEDSKVKRTVAHKMVDSLRPRRDPSADSWDPPNRELVDYIWTSTQSGSLMRKLVLKVFARVVANSVDYNIYPEDFVKDLLKRMLKVSGKAPVGDVVKALMEVRGNPRIEHVQEGKSTRNFMREFEEEEEEEEDVAHQVA